MGVREAWRTLEGRVAPVVIAGAFFAYHVLFVGLARLLVRRSVVTGRVLAGISAGLLPVVFVAAAVSIGQQSSIGVPFAFLLLAASGFTLMLVGRIADRAATGMALAAGLLPSLLLELAIGSGGASPSRRVFRRARRARAARRRRDARAPRGDRELDRRPRRRRIRCDRRRDPRPLRRPRRSFALVRRRRYRAARAHPLARSMGCDRLVDVDRAGHHGAPRARLDGAARPLARGARQHLGGGARGRPEPGHDRSRARRIRSARRRRCQHSRRARPRDPRPARRDGPRLRGARARAAVAAGRAPCRGARLARHDGPRRQDAVPRARRALAFDVRRRARRLPLPRRVRERSPSPRDPRDLGDRRRDRDAPRRPRRRGRDAHLGRRRSPLEDERTHGARARALRARGRAHVAPFAPPRRRRLRVRRDGCVVPPARAAAADGRRPVGAHAHVRMRGPRRRLRRPRARLRGDRAEGRRPPPPRRRLASPRERCRLVRRRVRDARAGHRHGSDAAGRQLALRRAGCGRLADGHGSDPCVVRRAGRRARSRAARALAP